MRDEGRKSGSLAVDARAQNFQLQHQHICYGTKKPLRNDIKLILIVKYQNVVGGKFFEVRKDLRG